MNRCTPIAILLGLALSATCLAQSTRFSSDFPSGSIGDIKAPLSDGEPWQLALRDDNYDASLPNNFRTWWYIRADDVDTTHDLTMAFTRIGWNYDFRPVYSYDNQTWHYFADGETHFAPGCVISAPDTCRMTITKRFDHPTVWIARTFPYPLARLHGYLSSIERSPFVQRRIIGQSPVLGLPIEALTIANPYSFGRQRVVIHARTHAAETGSSYVLEGLIGALLRDDDLGRSLRSRYVFNIVPMHNVDGVQVGNYRTNATSLNLENRWFVDRDHDFPVHLLPSAPAESKVLNDYVFAPAVTNQMVPTVLALNLHSSNSEANTQAFFFPHFGNDPAKYTPSQIALWHKQLDFIRSVASHYEGRIEQPSADGGAGFLNSAFMETWWWQHRQDGVNAITLETTYGRAGFDHWVTQDDLRMLGVALARAIDDMDRPASRLFKAARADNVFRAPFNPEVYQNEEDH